MNGSKELCEKIKALKKKGILPPNATSTINPDISAVENFLALNSVCFRRRVLAPMSPFGDRFISLSELDKVFWKNNALKRLLQEYAKPDYPSLEHVEEVGQTEVGYWLSRVEPGYLITRLITDIGGYTPEERKKLKDFRRAASVMKIDEMRKHLVALQKDDFQHKTYQGRGYVLRGSIKTDGFQLQLLAFKMNELNG
ncbi:hypothetical protein EDD11_000822, partial [Mortierella claussenii]